MNMEPRGDVQSTSGEVAPIEPSPSPRMEGEDEEEEEALGQSGGMKKAVEEFHGAGSVLGELGVLESASHVLSIQCETPVRVSSSSIFLSLSASLLSTFLFFLFTLFYTSPPFAFTLFLMA